jgi:hypothetical protein
MSAHSPYDTPTQGAQMHNGEGMIASDSPYAALMGNQNKGFSEFQNLNSPNQNVLHSHQG